MKTDLAAFGLDISNIKAAPTDLGADGQVTCLCCAQTFKAIYPGQGDGCASEYDPLTRELTGHYGSALIDFETHFVAESVSMPDHYGLVCDGCIETMLTRGQLTELATYL